MRHEPLLWYMLAGGVIFVLHGVLAPPDPHTITISAATEAGLEERFTARTHRPPTPAERDALVEQEIDEALLWREGQAIGLVDADPVVRRRTIQQMRALAESAGGIPTPDDAALTTLLAAAPDRYARPVRVAFTQVREAHRPEADPAPLRADADLAALQAGADPGTLGDPDLHGRTRPLTPLPAIAAEYGQAFADALAAAPVATWTRVDTADGAHLLHVDARDPGGPATLAEARARLVEDWTQARRDDNARAALAALRTRYRIVRDAP